MYKTLILIFSMWKACRNAVFSVEKMSNALILCVESFLCTITMYFFLDELEKGVLNYCILYVWNYFTFMFHEEWGNYCNVSDKVSFCEEIWMEDLFKSILFINTCSLQQVFAFYYLNMFHLYWCNIHSHQDMACLHFVL